MLRYIRGHRGIENRCHWVFDAIYREVHSRTHPHGRLGPDRDMYGALGTEPNPPGNLSTGNLPTADPEPTGSPSTDDFASAAAAAVVIDRSVMLVAVIDPNRRPPAEGRRDRRAAWRPTPAAIVDLPAGPPFNPR